VDSKQFINGFPGVLVPTLFDEELHDGTLRTVHGEAFVPARLPPTVDFVPIICRQFDLLDRVKTSLLRLEAMIDTLPGRTVLLSAMKTREAQASSRIENTYASIREIALAAVDDRRASGEPGEVLRNCRAIDAGLASSLLIGNRLLCMMHKILIVDRRHRPGQFRDKQVCIGDRKRGFAHARFVPPPGTHVDTCMRDWELFCNPRAVNAPSRAKLPYFIELALMHYQFEAIHPFSDGNGRLGRALVTLAPVKDGVLRHPVCNLSEWVQSNREEYYDSLLHVSTRGDWEPWIQYFCRSIAEQADADLARAKRLSTLYSKYTAQLTTKRSSMLAMKLLDHLFDKQAVTVTQAAELLGISYTAAQRHIAHFELLKVVKLYKDEPWGRIYIAEGVVKAIRGHGEDEPSSASR
jgi:Fic family protein